MHSPFSTRRDFLSNSSLGLGTVALSWMLHQDALRAEGAAPRTGVPSPGTAPLRGHASALKPHFAPKAKRIVQIFACGGVSHIETFDHKPDLEKLHGKSLEGKGENKGFFGQPGKIMKSVFPFGQHGQCGAWVSDLLPNIAGCVDDLCFIHSMTNKNNNHTPATFFMNTGSTLNGYPSMGAWLSYGLGTENENLPTFVVLPDAVGHPAGGSINWTAGFLPASHQGVAFRTQPGSEPIVDLETPKDVSPASREAAMNFLKRQNTRYAEGNPGDTALTARIRSYELAARMQATVPEAADLDSEPAALREAYGLNDKRSEAFGRNCLLARRLLERGTRFVQIFNGGAFGSPRINWDAHEDMRENHTKMAATMDKPVAALIKDLKQRGMLEDTLFVWCTEFGRGPATQGIDKPGRDHHPDGFTVFLAGAGVKKGFRYGSTDEVGYFASENPVTVYDFHATILHLLGLNHEKLTFYFNGINRRLTDVHGHVVKDILA